MLAGELVPAVKRATSGPNGVDVIGIFQVGTVGKSVAWTDTGIVRVNPGPRLVFSLGVKSLLSVFCGRRAEDTGTPLLFMTFLHNYSLVSSVGLLPEESVWAGARLEPW